MSFKRIALALVWSTCLFAMPAMAQVSYGDADSAELQPNVDDYVVQQGDTLWDITERVYGKAWVWPKVWSYNPEISNPHWIYPGDQIRFYPSDGNYPVATIDDALEEEVPEESYDPPPPAPVIEEINRGKPQKPGYESRRFVQTFVTPRELQESGKLNHSFEDKILLSFGDRVYIKRFKESVNPGDKLLIYRTVGKVEHPKNGKTWGYMTEITGLAVVERANEGIVYAKLASTVREVERDQLVTLYKHDPRVRLVPQKASRDVEGVVLSLDTETLAAAAAQQVVFVDKGAGDGLRQGDTLRVFAKGDPYTGTTKNLPFHHVAELMVIDAKDNASACLVLGGEREIAPGATVRTVTN